MIKLIQKCLVLNCFFIVLSFTFCTYKAHGYQYEKVVKASFDSKINFNMYVDKFYRDLEYFGVYPVRPEDIIIRFSELEQIKETTHIHGISFGYNNDDKIEIYINPNSWSKFNKAQKYFLLYHELAHDVLNADDVERIEMNKGHLMYPGISSFENLTMDEFIESSQEFFTQQINN